MKLRRFLCRVFFGGLVFAVFCTLLPSGRSQSALHSPGAGRGFSPLSERAAHSETAAQAMREIKRLYQVFDAMYDVRNAEGQLVLYMPDFVATDQNGNEITFAQMSRAVRMQCARDLKLRQEKGRTLEALKRTVLTRITLTGGRAAVRWMGHVEALSSQGGAWGHVAQDSTGEDYLSRTPRGWRFQRGRVFTSHRIASGGLTPQGVLAVQRVFQAKRLLDLEIVGEQASDDQQQQIRIEQNQHDEQVWRKKHGS